MKTFGRIFFKNSPKSSPLNKQVWLVLFRSQPMYHFFWWNPCFDPDTPRVELTLSYTIKAQFLNMNDLLCNKFDPITIGHCIGEMVEKETMNFYINCRTWLMVMIKVLDIIWLFGFINILSINLENVFDIGPSKDTIF